MLLNCVKFDVIKFTWGILSQGGCCRKGDFVLEPNNFNSIFFHKSALRSNSHLANSSASVLKSVSDYDAALSSQ